MQAGETPLSMKVTILLRMRGAFCTKLLPVYDKPGLVNGIRFASLCMYCIQACEWFLASLIMYSFNSMWGDCLRTQRPLLVRKVIYHTLSIISGRIRDQYANPIFSVFAVYVMPKCDTYLLFTQFLFVKGGQN